MKKNSIANGEDFVCPILILIYSSNIEYYIFIIRTKLTSIALGAFLVVPLTKR
jgi:hypothetical protein